MAEVGQLKQVKRFKALKPTYSVLCHRVDCGDEEVFLLEGAENLPLHKARKAMLKDFQEMRESYSPEWSVDGRDPCATEFIPNGRNPMEIYFYIPIWDGEREKESQITCHWSIIRH